MNPNRTNKSSILTNLVIIVSVCGIMIFGYLAITDNLNYSNDNPFDYNIDNFKKTDSNFLHYTETNSISLDFETSRALAVGTDGKIFVAGDNSVKIFSSSGKLLSSFTVESTVYTIAADRNEDLYLGMSTNIEVYDKSGTKKSSWESLGEKAIVTSVAVSDEFVFVADAGAFIVWKYDKNGKILQRIGDRNDEKDIPGFIIPTPYFDVSIDPDGFLWVVNPGRHSVENYTFEGDIRTSWGEFGMETEGFSGCCNPIHIAILNDGKFVTSEKGIQRVKVYNRIGELESVVAEPSQFLDYTEGLDLAVDAEGRIYVLDSKKKAVRTFEKK